MVLSLFRKRSRRRAPAAFDAPVEAPGLIYAVGDIHGRRDLAEALTGQILDDLDKATDAGATIVFMGDYIDRGEQSRETIDFLTGFAGPAGVATVFLMGNHEQMLLRFLREPGTGAAWLRYGGLQTLMSYGVGHAGSLRDPDGALRLRDDLAAALGDHLGFLEGLRLSHRAGNLLFAHAGADPELPVEEQAPHALLWGSEGFLTTPRSDRTWVVHGHYVVETPSAADGRIAVDTGAYFSHRLTAARIAGGEVTFLET